MNLVGMEKGIHKRSLSLIMMMFMILAVGLVWNGVVCNGEGRTALVTGMVFCDQCSWGSLSALSHPLAGAEVILECKQGLETASFVASTDDNGVFSISVEEEDGFEIHGAGRTCIVQLAKSNDLHCHVPTDMENGVSGAIISRTGGIYREKVVYYVGPFAYRVNHPPEACNAVKLNSRHASKLQRSMVSLGSLRAKSRGLKTVLDRGLGDKMLTIPSSALTMPFTLGDGIPTIPSTAVTMPPSYNLPVTRPTPVDENPHLVKPPQVSREPSPVKCIPLPPIPLDPDLAKLNIHYPPCRIQPPQRGGTTFPPQTPDIPSPIGSSPPKDTAPKIGNGPPKDKSPSYGGPPMGKSSPPPPRHPIIRRPHPHHRSPPPPLTHPIRRPHPHHRSPPPPPPRHPIRRPHPHHRSPPPPPPRHPIHRPHPHHRSPPPPQKPSLPSPYKSPPPPSTSKSPPRPPPVPLGSSPIQYRKHTPLLHAGPLKHVTPNHPLP